MEIALNYKLNHFTITMDSLNKKIMKASEDFYYLLYIGNHLSVIDAFTGDIVYAQQISEINSHVMDDLYKAIMKG